MKGSVWHALAATLALWAPGARAAADAKDTCSDETSMLQSTVSLRLHGTHQVYREGVVPLSTEFIIDGLPKGGVLPPTGSDRACIQNGGSVKSFSFPDEPDFLLLDLCNSQCATERREGRGCWAFEHDLQGENGTCKIFTEPVEQTLFRRNATCARLGPGGEVPTVTTCPSSSSSRKKKKSFPHDLMTTSPNCSKPVMKTQCMTRRQYSNIAKEVKRALRSIDGTCVADNCPQADWAGCVLRMAGHDFMDYDAATGEGESGANACTDMNHPDNRGLKACLSKGEHGESLKRLYETICTTVSLADFLVIAAEAVMTAAREIALADNPKGPTINFQPHFRYGRRTAMKCPGAAERLPNPESGCDAVKETFVERMGLAWRETAALMGVHTLGRARAENSGYDGWWSDPINSRKFNNNYYVQMVAKGWRPMRAVCGNANKNQWYMSGPLGVKQGSALEMMLDTDLCLAYANSQNESRLPVKASRDHCCAWLVEHPTTKAYLGTFTEICGLFDMTDCGSVFELAGFGAAGEYITEFIESEEAWLGAFLKAWGKATENGFQGLKKLGRSCP